ncbi:hypothetical protein CBM2637_B130297 [Cupriavidus taiwanensis]|nr:hypothetical protein CBM2637_B130297 [Cupriavidus taiwanensis]
MVGVVLAGRGDVRGARVQGPQDQGGHLRPAAGRQRRMLVLLRRAGKLQHAPVHHRRHRRAAHPEGAWRRGRGGNAAERAAGRQGVPGGVPGDHDRVPGCPRRCRRLRRGRHHHPPSEGGTGPVANQPRVLVRDADAGAAGDAVRQGLAGDHEDRRGADRNPVPGNPCDQVVRPVPLADAGLRRHAGPPDRNGPARSRGGRDHRAPGRHRQGLIAPEGDVPLRPLSGNFAANWLFFYAVLLNNI